MVDKHYNEEDSPYYHKTAEEIIEMWDNKATTSRSYGSNLDDYIGMNLNEQLDELSLWKLDHNFYDDKRLNGICTGFDQYYKLLQEKTDYQYVTRELTLYIKSIKPPVIHCVHSIVHTTYNNKFIGVFDPEIIILGIIVMATATTTGESNTPT